MIDQRTKEFIEKTVRENFIPDNLNSVLKNLEGQLEEAQGDKKIVIEGFILGIKKVLGKVS